MKIGGLAIKEEFGREETVNVDLTYKAQESGTKMRKMLCRFKHILGKVVTADEDWIFKSKDWPCLWTRK